MTYSDSNTMSDHIPSHHSISPDSSPNRLTVLPPSHSRRRVTSKSSILTHSSQTSLSLSASAYLTSVTSVAPSLGNFPTDLLFTTDHDETESSLFVPLPMDTHLPWYKRRKTIACLVGFSLFVDMVVYGAVVPILPYIASEKLNIDESSLGFLFASYALGLLLSTPPMAYLSDRYRNRRIPMIIGLLGLSITTILFAFATQYWQLVLARTLQGFSAGAPWTVGLSLLADVYPPAYLGSVIGPVLACNHAGFIAGPVVGGWLFQYLGYKATFYFSAGLAVLNLLFRLITDESHYLNGPIYEEESLLASSSSSPSPSPSPSDSNNMYNTIHSRSPSPVSKKLGMLTLLKGVPIQLYVLVTIIVGGIFAGLEPTLPLHLRDAYSLSPSEIGTAFVSLIIPSMMTSTIAGRLSDRIGGYQIMICGVMLLAVTAPLPAIPGIPLWLKLCALALFGGSQSFAMTPIVPMMAQYVSNQGSASFASVYGIFNMAYSFAVLIGPSIAGILYAKLNFLLLMVTFSASLGVLLIPVIIVPRFNISQFNN